MNFKISRILLFPLCIFALVFILNIKSSALSGTDGEFIITNENGGYLVERYDNGSEADNISYSSLNDFFSLINGGKIYFKNVSLEENLTVNKGDFVFFGSIGLSETASFDLGGADVSFENLYLSSNGGKIRIKSGSLTVIDSEIEALSDTLFLLERSSSAHFEILSGKLIAKTDAPIIANSSSTVKISGGEIFGNINNSASLILSGSPALHSGIYSDTPIWLSDGENEFRGSADIYTNKSFENGNMYCLFYSASEESLSGITVYDVLNSPLNPVFFTSYNGIGEKNFGAVYLPFSVEFTVDGQVVNTQKLLLGERPNAIASPDKTGYCFQYWSRSGGGAFDFSAGVYGNVRLEAVYSLTPPTFSINSISSVYDKSAKILSLANLSHPLLDEGELTYLWYKDGEVFSSSENIEIINVGDSGVYRCTLTFACNGERVSVDTPSVNVKIDKAIVDFEGLAPRVYTGKLLFPAETDTELYRIESEGGIDAGIYEARITLCDSENYRFSSGEDETLILNFEILKAENEWKHQLEIPNLYVGNIPRPRAEGKFGDVTYLYSEREDGEYTDTVPLNVGKYYVVASVSGTENYSSLRSLPVPFEIYSEQIISMSINTPSIDRSYVAFEKFDPAGLTFLLLYDSGRKEIIGGGECEFIYNSGDSFKYGDSGILASYKGCTAFVSLEVERAEYNFDGFAFSDFSTEYNGERISIFYSGSLPVGLDGTVPEVNIIGGGINVGSYTVILEFSVDGNNYKTPERRIATLTILPKEVELTVSETEFVYDGASKSPTAYYYDVFGRQVFAEICGEKSLVGEYSAVAVSQDSNYKITNSKIDFKITKANYDMSRVVFSDCEFVYDGTEKSISIISGLPDGVSVIGYSDACGVGAGIYYADFTFSYDTRNYNPPELSLYEWEIKKAQYVLPDNAFSDNVSEYDGFLHYPLVNCEMPVGKDGVPLRYEFSSGALEVNDGRVFVTVSFFSDSENYTAPESIIRYVEILPKEITVSWENKNFIYNGEKQAPTAWHSECAVIVFGGAFDAGEYRATAISADNNYKIVNSEFDFIIDKAENFWKSEPEISDVFFGKEPAPSAIAHAGETEFRFYTSKELSEEVTGDLAVGIYYMQAYSDGDKNYSAILSDPVRFEVKAILPIGISVSLKKNTFVAFGLIDGSDIVAFILNNDSSQSPLDLKDLKIEYQNGSSLRYGDGYVGFSYGEFFERVDISVNKADYDMSGVAWENTEFTYDGTAHQSTLTGLPDGVSVIEYIGALAVDAGEYPLSVRLEYDRDNYNAPLCPGGVLIIKKAEIEIPKIENLIYNGKIQVPKISESIFYSIDVQTAKEVGRYSVSLKVKDSRNYSLCGSEELTLYYEIEPLEVKIDIPDVHTYFFERSIEPSYEIMSGELPDGEWLDVGFEISDGKIYAISKNKSHRLVYSPGEIINHSSFSKRGQETLFILTLIFIMLLLFGIAVYFSRYKIRRIILEIKGKFTPIIINNNEVITESATEETVPEISQYSLQEPTSTEEKNQIKEENGDILFPINASEADTLISDNLAKSLLAKEKAVIYTNGKKRTIINVDTLSKNFGAGEKVDINDLKARSLVPYDTAYIKVLARGVIDKSLKVYANDFSLSAVKMIALTGGEAIRSVTRSEKNENKNDKKT